MLSQEFTDVVGVPSYYVDEYNATPMASFWCVIERIVAVMRPAVVCEIGSERGITSRMIADRLPGTRVMIVDPVVHPSVSAKANVEAFQETSKTFLDRGAPVELYVVDGDHNHETVTLEIAGALRNRPDGRPFCMLFHDVSWPFARRDGYYDPASVERPLPHSFDTTLVLEDEERRTGRGGFESGRTFALADRSGGAGNGVLTAIEDFLIGAGASWRFETIPLFFGLGILWDESALDGTQAAAMRELAASLELLRPMLACAEANRMRLHQGLGEHMRDVDGWKADPLGRVMSDRDGPLKRYWVAALRATLRSARLLTGPA